MIRSIALLPAFLFFASAVSAQTVKDNIDKQVKDPAVAKEAGKADVYKMNKSIMDTAILNPQVATSMNQKNSLKKKRKKHCKKK